MTDRLILVYSKNKKEFLEFLEFLKKHFDVAVNTNINENTRDPYAGGVRGYVQLVGNPKEDGDDE